MQSRIDGWRVLSLCYAQQGTATDLLLVLTRKQSIDELICQGRL